MSTSTSTPDLAQARLDHEVAIASMESTFAALEANPNDSELQRKFDHANRAVSVANARIALAETSTATDGFDVRVRNEGDSQLTYRQNGSHSIFRDLARVKIDNDPTAGERLQRHREEMGSQSRAHPSQTAGEGGEFIPPVWLQDRWIKLPRPSRAFADTLTNFPLPDGTNQVNLPKVSGGATVEVQTDGNSVSSTDMTTTSVTAQVQTVAGQQDVSIQLLDMSAPGFDQVVFDDLTRAYDAKLDTKLITGTVTNAKGIRELSGVNEVSFTQATPTVPLLYPKVANGIQLIQTEVFEPPSVIAMHPRRWAWALAALDSQNRPLIVPGDGGMAFNQIAVVSSVAPQAVVGRLQGMPVVVDPNIPTNEGASTNADPVFIYRAENLFLWEGAPKLRTFGEVLSNTLQVRFQVYSYYAVMLGRLPKAITKIQGTGLVAPAF
ncbi:MAG: phage major capsid protein [Actinobacteria bacterium]|nr:phage major capsid protein [Actinomycetota bacterium]